MSRFALPVALLLASVICRAQQSTPVPTHSPQVEHGKYLATAGNCVSCHTRPGGPPFAGGVAFQTPLGRLYSTNITPEPDSGIGRWSAQDLRRAMHEGIARDGSHLFPAFPYTAFTKVSDADVSDIYAYLRTLRPVSYTPPANGSLFSMRWAMSVWNKMFFTAGRFVGNPAKSAEWNRGAYLVEGLGHCSACHTPRGAFLAERSDEAYAGAGIEGEVAKDKQGHWFAVNLTSARHGLASWSVADLEKYFRTGASFRGGAFGPMNEVIVSSLKLLAPADQHAMAVYVKSLQGPEYAGEKVSPELVSAGATIYKERCEKCHGASGRGGFFSGPPLTGSAVVQGEDPASLINTIVHGPVLAQDVSYGAWETMSAYGDVLGDSEVAAVSNFVRGSWGNRASPVSPKSVSRQR